MKVYMPSQLRDRLRSWSYTKKRILTILSLSTLFSFLLFARNSPHMPRSVHIEEEDLGRPGAKFGLEDEWQPPPNWDPVYPVWTNFTRYCYWYNAFSVILIVVAD